MPFVASSPSCQGFLPARRLASAICCAAMLGACASVMAQLPEFASSSIAELERIFWVCDYASTTGPVSLGLAAPCSRAYEALKERKFDGDFRALQAWWRENKAVQHQVLEMQSQAAERTAPSFLRR